MERASFRDMNCAVAQCLEVVGEWWSLLIVRDAFLGVTRFDDFQARLGISRNVLQRRLERLVDEGVFERVEYQRKPPRFDYRLTAKGRDLWLVLTAMREWGDRWAMPNGPSLELEHRSCGHRATVTPTCSECGDELRLRDLRARRGPGATDDGLLPRPRDQRVSRRGAATR
jgi:DNA-binding HxlR family transcriptional regulator